MEPSSPARSSGPGLRDLIGFMVGFAVSASLLRHIGPGDSANPVSWAGFLVAFLWYGLAASGPFVAWLFRPRGFNPSPERFPTGMNPSESREPLASNSGDDLLVSSRSRGSIKLVGPERAWIHFGTLLVFFAVMGRYPLDPMTVSSHLGDLTWINCLILNVVLVFVGRPPIRGWTDRLAWLILLTWPFAVGGLWLTRQGG